MSVPPLNDTPRMCCNKGCQQVYVPTSNSQKWCPDCIDLGDRDRLLNRRHASTSKGRICACCMRLDSEVGFHGKTECAACFNRGNKNGRCPDCKQPLRKLGNKRGSSYCEECEPPEYPPEYLSVELMWNGDRRTVFKSQGCKFRDPTAGARPRNLSWLKHQQINGGEIVMQVNLADYVAGFTMNPLAVKGMPGWPTWLESAGKVSKKFYEDLVDLLHLLRMEDSNPVQATWWISKFSSTASPASAARGWERFKIKFAALGIAFDRVLLKDLDQISGASTEILLNVDVKELALFVATATQIQERRELLRDARRLYSKRRLQAAKDRKIRGYLQKKSDPSDTLGDGGETPTARHPGGTT